MNNNLITSTDYNDTSTNMTGAFEQVANLTATYMTTNNLRINDTIGRLTSNGLQTFATNYNYDAINRLSSSTIQVYSNVTGLWTNNSKFSYSYDASGRLTKIVTDFWNSNQQWQLNDIDTFGYSGSAQAYTFYEHIGSNASRSIVILNSFQAPDTVYTFYKYNGSWMLARTATCTYNTNAHLTNYTSTEFGHVTVHRWHYGPLSKVNDMAIATEDFAYLYPNPTVKNLNIDIAKPDDRIEIVILNTSGQPLRKFSVPGTRKVAIDISSLPSGTYFAVIRMKSKVQHCNFIKL